LVEDKGIDDVDEVWPLMESAIGEIRASVTGLSSHFATTGFALSSND
jgi:hypothetical protein